MSFIIHVLSNLYILFTLSQITFLLLGYIDQLDLGAAALVPAAADVVSPAAPASVVASRTSGVPLDCPTSGS